MAKHKSVGKPQQSKKYRDFKKILKTMRFLDKQNRIVKNSMPKKLIK
jgi:hypothetical protein